MKTAEAVMPGHPDKVADQISDAILDEYLRRDPYARVAVETMGGHGKLYICGEVTAKGKPLYKNEIVEIARRVYARIGYKDRLKIQVNIVNQSPDISQGVEIGGAGDQGIMVGYACNENEQMIPQELYLARKLIMRIYEDGIFGPDGKCQVTLTEDNQIDTVVLSVQTHDVTDIKKGFVEKFLGQSVKNYHFNPTGKFEIGGFAADTGLTGRKLAVDNYGPQIPVGGGAFSGKDPSKVDRSAAYMARRVAIDALRFMEAENVTVKLAYSIGVAKPVMAMVDINGKEQEDTEKKAKWLMAKHYDFTPEGIIRQLDLRKPIYEITAREGHFGNEIFSWEK